MSRSMVEIKCPRCGGTGWIPQFGHYAKGVCFRCYGAKVVKVKARPDGTADHSHRLSGYYPNFGSDCAECHLPVSEWPTVVPAHWWGDRYVVYLPDAKTETVPGIVARKTQAAVRALVAERVPNHKIKWINRVAA